MKNISGYNGVYKVTRLGRIFKFEEAGMIEIKPCVNSWGYLVFSMSKNGVRKMYKLHRVVAIHFVHNPNPKKLKQVNHKDGNKLNCKDDNLEWNDNKMNNVHKVEHGLVSGIKKRIPESVKKKILAEHLLTGMGSCLLAKKFSIGINSAYRIIKDY